MHERIEMKTHALGVAVSAGWPMLAALAVFSAMVLAIFPFSVCWPIIAMLAGAVALTFLWCLRLYLGAYLFLPATEYKGARIIARLGRSNEIEISGVLAEEIIVKQGWLEKALGVCHIRQKGTTIYLRGVQNMSAVAAWVEANFPRERKAAPIKVKKQRR